MLKFRIVELSIGVGYFGHGYGTYLVAEKLQHLVYLIQTQGFFALFKFADEASASLHRLYWQVRAG
jgi:hypothetical protein